MTGTVLTMDTASYRLLHTCKDLDVAGDVREHGLRWIGHKLRQRNVESKEEIKNVLEGGRPAVRDTVCC